MVGLWCAVGAAGLGPAGCEIGPDFESPATPVAEAWSSTSDPRGLAATTQPVSYAASLEGWWASLNDATLTGLVERALASNLDVQLADARVREVIAARRGAVAELFPTLGLASLYEHQRSARNRSVSEDGDGASATVSNSASNLSGVAPPRASVRVGDYSASITPATPGSGQGVPEIDVSRSRTFGGNGGGFRRDGNLYETLFGASWEIDLWGSIRRGIEAAEAEVFASMEDRRGVLVALTAEVARNYVGLRATQRLLEITRQNIDIQRDTVQTIETRFAASTATATDVMQARTQLMRTESDVPQLEAGILTAIYRLSVLLGAPPGALLSELGDMKPLPVTPDVLALLLPSELLRRRPDVRAAERRVEAETARIGVQMGELFPRVSLTASFGLQTAEVENYVEGDSLAWGFGPAVRWRLLEFGRILSRIEAQEAAAAQAVIVYQQTVLTAFEEVEAGLANFAAERRRAEALDEVNAVNLRAVESAKSEYTVGRLSFLSVLDTQRSLFATQTELLQSRRQELIEMINVYEALGGGWPDEDESE